MAPDGHHQSTIVQTSGHIAVKGEDTSNDEAKRRYEWAQAVNTHGGFGTWKFKAVP
jgi:hypothetical protein